MKKPTVLIKLTGMTFEDQSTGELSNELIKNIANQIKDLQHEYSIGLVSGGGNFFRGAQHGARLDISMPYAHQIGMLATMMNGLIIKDTFNLTGIDSTLFCGLPCPEVGRSISQQEIHRSVRNEHVLIFSGGTGVPYFSTDTNAVIRALEMGATEVWKGTNVDGLFTKDPHKHNDATYIEHATYKQAIDQDLRVMDMTAFELAREHNLTIRIFNIFKPNALINAQQNKRYGSTITN